MQVSLIKATDKDASLIFDMQVKAFTPLLNTYKDDKTNPAIESVNRVKERINHPDGGFYKIIADNTLVGAICIFWKHEINFWISPMFILPSYQGKGLAQKAITLVEEMFPQAITWELATIFEEKRNCYLYEKMGYKNTSVYKKINDHATLVFYKKFS